MGKIFVQAKPSKISITETYNYKGIVGDNPQWDFKKAEGEIKIEFPFDGHYNGHFDRSALKDLRRQDPEGQAKRALVGHLAFVDAGRTSWNDLSLEGRTIPITMDVENIQEKIEGSQKFSMQISYQPKEPESRPFNLGEVKLTDQEPIQDISQVDYQPQLYPYLTLSMSLKTPVNDGLLHAGDLSLERINEIIESIKHGQTHETKSLPGDCSAEDISDSLLELAKTDLGGILVIGLDTAGKITGLAESDEKTIRELAAQAIFMKNLPIPITPPEIKTVDVDDEVQTLAFILVPPGLRNRYNEHKRNDGFDIPIDETITKSLVDELLESYRSRNDVFFTEKISDKPEDFDLMAKVFAGLANEGGYVISGIQQQDDAHDDHYVIKGLDSSDLSSAEQVVAKVLGRIKPWLNISCHKNFIPYRRTDGSPTKVLVLKVLGDPAEVYSFGNHCWQIETYRHSSEIHELEPEVVFRLLSQKYERFLRRALIRRGEPPRISYGCVRWPHTVLDVPDSSNTRNRKDCGNLPGPSRSQYQVEEKAYLPSKYDPLQGAIEWHDVSFDISVSPQFFETVLQLEVRNPEDLRDPDDGMINDFKGHFVILLSSPMLSGLEIDYFDALGKKLKSPQRERIISQETKIILDMDLHMSGLFRKRDFSPYRQLEFEGVLPEGLRYEDIREVLYDCGLRITSTKDFGPIIQKGLTRHTMWTAESRSATGKFKIWLIVTNYWYGLEREISYGERTDKLSVPTGRMTIGVFGSVEGAENRDLTELINKLQNHLKERFKYVRIG